MNPLLSSLEKKAYGIDSYWLVWKIDEPNEARLYCQPISVDSVSL